jgi:hypothetical protein
MSPSGVEWSRAWVQPTPGASPLGAQLALAVVLGTLSSYVGLWFGEWMTKVRR